MKSIPVMTNSPGTPIFVDLLIGYYQFCMLSTTQWYDIGNMEVATEQAEI
jgi:hypothetical protein